MKNRLAKSALPLFSVLFLIICGCVISSSARAEEDGPMIKVSGTITASSNGTAIEGASVIVKGSNIGTSTNKSGQYSIETPRANDTLVISAVGYVTESIPLEGRSEIDVAMVSESKSLDGIVVVGYTSQKKRNLTSAVAIADVESMQKRSVTDPTQALQGNVAGVNIAAGNGNPGSQIHINVRGISSFSGDNNPLVIVDGVQIEGGLREVNANDIQSIQVLKDASSAAIYGSRAANGVVLVTTKRGDRKSTTAKLTYQNYVGIQMPYKGIPVANAQEYVEILQRMYGEDLSGDDLIPQAAKDYLANPNSFQDYSWQDEIYQAAPLHSHDLSVAGGGPSGTYRISAGYIDQRGITLATGYKRANIRANSEFTVNDRITLRQSVSFAKSLTNQEPFAFSRSVYSQAIKMYPYFAPKLPNGDWQTSSFYYGGGDNPEALIRNPFHYNSLWNGDQHNSDLSINMNADVKILDGLTYNISGSYSLGSFRTANYFGDKGEFQDEYFDDNLSLSERYFNSYNWNLDNTIRYKKEFGVHAVDVTVGYIAQQFGDRFLEAGKRQFLSPRTRSLSAPGGRFPSAESGVQESALVSAIAQVFYSFDDRYLFTVNFRRDGSSRFAQDYRWGNFPGISAGWRVSNEKFWENSNVGNVVTDFKVRAGYGILGRQNLGNYDFVPVLNYIPVEFGGAVEDGLITGTPINSAISWERLISKTVGIDYELWGGKVNGSFDYYNNDTRDMIIGVQIAPSVGGGEFQSNQGEINNRGFEMTINYNDRIGDLDFSAGFNLGTTRTRLLNIGRELVIMESGSPEWDVPHSIELHRGGGLSEFWLIRTDGIFKSQKEIDDHKSSDGTLIQPNAEPGDIKFIDANDDGEITSEGDRQLVGTGVPKVNLGFNLSLKYKNFDFFMGATGAFGQVIYNAINYLSEQPFGFGNFSKKLLTAYDPVLNPNANYPRLNSSDVDDNWNTRPTSDRFIENGNYLKIRNIELGYQVPANILNRVKLASMRVFGRLQNIATFTNYSGADPEVGSSPIMDDTPIFTAGLDRDTAPQARSYLIGVNISF